MICAQVGAQWLLDFESNLIEHMKGKLGQLQLNQHIQSILLLMCCFLGKAIYCALIQQLLVRPILLVLTEYMKAFFWGGGHCH